MGLKKGTIRLFQKKSSKRVTLNDWHEKFIGVVATMFSHEYSTC